jgi:hypothetical protein
MATLQELLDEQAQITAELQRMENDEETTEEGDGNYRDTLIARWRKLDEDCKPIIARMEKIKAITRTAQDPANLERPAERTHQRVPLRLPDLVITNNRDPYDGYDLIRSERQILMPRSEIKSAPWTRRAGGQAGQPAP